MAGVTAVVKKIVGNIKNYQVATQSSHTPRSQHLKIKSSFHSAGKLVKLFQS